MDYELLKHNKPSTYDYAQEGTIIKVIDHDTEEYYIQISPYIDFPDWITWGEFLGIVFKKKALNEEFVLKCITKFRNRKIRGSKSLH